MKAGYTVRAGRLCIVSAGLLARIALSQPIPLHPADQPVVCFRAAAGVTMGFSGLVSAWDDPRGPGVSQTSGSRQPQWQAHAIHGRPALHFDGDDSLQQSSGMPTGDYTKVVVVTLDDYQAYNNVLSGASEHALFFGYGDRAMLFHNGTFVTSSQPTPLGEPTILIGTFDATTGEGNLYQNGQWVGRGFAPPHHDPAIQIGSYAFGANLRGSVAEAMVYDHVLTETQRRLLEQSLIARYRAGVVPEVTLSEWPQDGAVFARDVHGQASVHVSGVVRARGRPTIELRLFRGDTLVETQSQPLADPSGDSPFGLNATLVAGLHEYRLELALLDGLSRFPLQEARSLVCGDLYLVNGQSNAVAADYFGEGLANQSQSPWIRSYGTASLGNDVVFDHHWDLAEALLTNGHGSVGGWALRAGELLVAEEGVPIGMLNGAVGGTAVSQHQRNDADPEDLSTIYGRLLHRSRAAGIAQQYRAILWHQGESDGEYAGAWRTGFASLRQDWAEDYPGIERIFIFQIRKGCGVQFAGVREAQRELADDPEVSVMSTTAVPAHDGCHYRYVGYRTMGDRLARQIGRDLYGVDEGPNVDPPNIERVQWTNGSHTSLRLTFRSHDDSLAWDSGSESYLFLSDGTPVMTGTVSGNTITLQLARASSAVTLTYDGHAGDGPWIRNGAGVGALTFFNFPIQ